MGKKKVETTRTIGAITPEQRQLQKLLLGQADSAAGQFGDLSGLAAGNLSQLTPEMERAIQESQGAARLGVEQNFEQGLRDQRVEASSRGIAGSSIDAIGQAFLGQSRSNQLAGLDSQAAQQRLQLPFQMAQQQLAANQLLQQMLSGSANPALGALSQERLGQGSSTETTSGGGFSAGFELATGLASGGAFGAGGRFGKVI